MPNTDEAYGRAVRTLLHDESMRRELESDPEGTLRRLGLEITPEAARLIREAQSQPIPAEKLGSAFVSSVATPATSPAVSVVVSVATSAVEQPERQ
jgi:transposase